MARIVRKSKISKFLGGRGFERAPANKVETRADEVAKYADLAATISPNKAIVALRDTSNFDQQGLAAKRQQNVGPPAFCRPPERSRC